MGKFDTDAEYLKRVQREMRLSQYKVAALLGISQSTVSRIASGQQRLNKLEKAELKRRWALYQIHLVVEAGHTMTLKPCSGHTAKDFNAFMVHLEKCPMCLVRAYRSITGAKRKP